MSLYWNVEDAWCKRFCFAACVCIKSSLKDDDSGDHDQDQGSPKDSEKEKTEDEEKEQNTTKKKASHFKNDLYIQPYLSVCSYKV